MSHCTPAAVHVALAKRLVDEQGAVIVDVGSHAAEIESLPGRNKDTPVVVYCGPGRRAATAKETLGSLGDGRVTNLGGVDDRPAGD